MNYVQQLGAQVLLLTQSARHARRSGLNRRELLRQLGDIAYGSAWLVILAMSFFGVVMVSIAHVQAQRVIGDLSVVGAAYFDLLVREFAPITTAILITARAGAATAAELGSMSVNEQLEALELSAGDPLAELVAPRVLASVVAVPLLTVIGALVSALTAALTAQFAFGADGSTFLNPREIGAEDLWCAGLKAVLCGVYIPLAASWRGLRAQGGAAAVGEAVTSGVVEGCLGCLAIDFAVALAFLLAGA